MKMSSPSRPYPSALSAISTESVIAHMPIPSAWAHLIRRLSATPSPRGEGSVAHQNFYVNITEVGRNRIPTIGIRISRQCPPQARPYISFFRLVQFLPPEGQAPPVCGQLQKRNTERAIARKVLSRRKKKLRRTKHSPQFFYKPFRIYSA